jgi:hypothetical protein
MAVAFQSPQFDDYSGRCKELDRRVLLRYRFDVPDPTCRSMWGNGNAVQYAKSLLQAGDLLEARGNRKGAFEKYRAVARFGQVIGSAGGHGLNQEFKEAYARLAAFSEREGNHEQAQLYAYLVDQIDLAEQNDRIARRKRYLVGEVTSWNASLARTSGLTLLLSAGLLLVCLFAVMVRSRTVRLSSLRPRRLTLALGTCGSVGLLLSSAILYASYRPYAEIFQRYIHRGDESEVGDLVGFLTGASDLPFDDQQFWFAVTVLCVVTLFLAVVVFLTKQLRARTSI